MPCPVLPILLKHFPQHEERVKVIGDDPDNSRQFLEELGLWENEWEELWCGAKRRNNDPDWVPNESKIEDCQKQLATLVIEKIRRFTCSIHN